MIRFENFPSYQMLDILFLGIIFSNSPVSNSLIRPMTMIWAEIVLDFQELFYSDHFLHTTTKTNSSISCSL